MSEITFKEIQDTFKQFMLLGDTDYIKLSYAALIGNQMPSRRPIWLMLVAPPSSGKTTALNAFNGLKIVNKASGNVMEPTANISDLTENSFASGMNRSEKQTSLLHKIPRGGVMIFKDFTSILSKQEQTRRVIMGQLREIYDGAYVKRTGNGEDVLWQGKIGAIAGVTETVYQHLETMSAMGDRFIMYQVHQPDRKEMLRFKLDQEKLGFTESSVMPQLKQMTSEYLQRAFDHMSDDPIVLPRQHEDEIIDVADFCTMVRSGLIVNDFTGKVLFVPQPEMPARMFEQMLALGAAFVFMRKLDDPTVTNEMVEDDFRIIYKIAFDSIPIVRRMALRYLTIYGGGADAASLARKINYETEVVSGWLVQLNALGVVDRVKRSSGANFWKLNTKYIKIMERLDQIKATSNTLEEDGVHDGGDEVEQHWNKNKSFEKGLDLDAIQEAISNDDW
jgi:hypothetical protein